MEDASIDRVVLSERIARVLLDSVGELNKQLPAAAHLHRSMDAALTGPGASLDSLGLINFIVTTEDKLEEEFGRRISLLDGDAIDERVEAFSTLGALAQHVARLLQGAG